MRTICHVLIMSGAALLGACGATVEVAATPSGGHFTITDENGSHAYFSKENGVAW
jgi:hypothetical protein